MMQQYEKKNSDTKVVVDETTIYEVDLECYSCLTDRELELYFGMPAREKEPWKAP